MRRRIRKALIWWFVANTVAWASLQLIARKLSHGDDMSQDVAVYTIWGGQRFRSAATHLRSVRAVATMGGLEVDLRGATIGADGADVAMRTLLGGMTLLVRRDWRVLVNAESMSAQFEDWTEDPEDLPDDAPVLRIEARTRLGGALVAYEPTRR